MAAQAAMKRCRDTAQNILIEFAQSRRIWPQIAGAQKVLFGSLGFLLCPGGSGRDCGTAMQRAKTEGRRLHAHACGVNAVIIA